VPHLRKVARNPVLKAFVEAVVEEVVSVEVEAVESVVEFDLRSIAGYPKPWNCSKSFLSDNYWYE
jgi:hypothetical protein